MTPIEAFNEFLKSPLGIYAGIVIAAAAAYVAAILKARGESRGKIEVAKAENAQALENTKLEAQKILQERDRQFNENIEAIRKIAMSSQDQIRDLRTDNDRLSEALDTAQSAASKARDSIEQLGTDLQKRETESRHNAESIQDLTKQIQTLRETIQQVEGERDSALQLVETRNGELAARDAELKQRDEQIERLTRDLEQTKGEVEQLHKRVDEFEQKKGDTGPLDGSKLPPEPPTEPKLTVE